MKRLLFQFRDCEPRFSAGGGLSGCGKKHEEEKPNAKADENIVTLTKANLEHVEIKTEPVARGSLSTTLRAPGRVSANLNKTAKVVATLEGRVSKLNYRSSTIASKSATFSERWKRRS